MVSLIATTNTRRLIITTHWGGMRMFGYCSTHLHSVESLANYVLIIQCYFLVKIIYVRETTRRLHLVLILLLSPLSFERKQSCRLNI